MLKIFVLFFILFSSAANAEQEKQDTLVRYCIDPDWMPYEGIRNGKHVGISKDYIQFISNAAAIQFEFVITDSWSHTIDAIKSGKCDVIPFINPSPQRRDFLSFTLSYFEAPNVLVTRREDDAIPGFSAVGDRLIGVVKGYRHAEYLSRYYPHFNVRQVENETQGLALLNADKLDVMVASLLSANSIIKNEQFDELVVSGFAEPHDTLAFGVSKNSEALVDVLNEAILLIPQSTKAQVYKRWYNVEPIPRDNNFSVLLIAILLAAMVAVVVWLRRGQVVFQKEISKRDKALESLQTALLEKSRAVEVLSTHDELTNLNNRNFMVQKVDEEMSRFRRFHTHATLLLIHIDSLSKVEQTSGEHKSEEIIVKLSQITLEKTREVDVAARWSNEDILVLCPQTSTRTAEILAERILTEVERHSATDFSVVKVSIGGASMIEGDNFADWLDRTQHAMRNAKKRPCHAYETATL